MPGRLRALHVARLRHVGLWQLGGASDEDDDEDEDGRSRRASGLLEGGRGLGVMGNVEVLDSPVRAGAKAHRRLGGAFGLAEWERRARSTLDLLEQTLEGSSTGWLLGGGGDSRGRGGHQDQGHQGPTTVDLALFGQLAIGSLPPWPERRLGQLLMTSYPRLVEHTRRLLALTFPSPLDTTTTTTAAAANTRGESSSSSDSGSLPLSSSSSSSPCWPPRPLHAGAASGRPSGSAALGRSLLALPGQLARALVGGGGSPTPSTGGGSATTSPLGGGEGAKGPTRTGAAAPSSSSSPSTTTTTRSAALKRWAYIGFVTCTFVGYVLGSGLVQIGAADDDDDDDNVADD